MTQEVKTTLLYLRALAEILKDVGVRHEDIKPILETITIIMELYNEQ